MTGNEPSTGAQGDFPAEAERIEAVARLDLFREDAYQAAFDDAALLASVICEAPIGLITVVDGTHQRTKSCVGIELPTIPRRDSFCAHTIRQPDLLEVGDTLLDDRFRQLPLVVTGPRVRFYAAMPLATKEGFAVGALCVLDTVPRALTDSQKKALAVLSRRVAAYFEAREQEIHLTRTIAEKERLEAELRNRNLVFDAIMDNSPLACFMKDERGHLVYYNRRFAEDMRISRSAWLGRDEFDVFAPDLAIQLRQSEDEIIKSDKLSVMEVTIPVSDVVQRCVRIYKFSFVNASGDRFLVGISHEITDERKAKEELARTHVKLLKANKQLHELSVTDALTGCKNRRFFDRELSHEFALARRHELRLSVLLIDVDNFKKVNDTYGHEEGDRVLKHIAQLLLGGARKTDTVCRYGGEEFAVLLPHTSERKAFLLADRMRESLEQKWEGCAVTMSAGVGSYSDCLADAQELLRSADVALYRAKAAGKNRVVLAAV